MHAMLSNLMAATLLIHALLGCRGFGAVACTCQPAQAAPERSHCSSCHEHGASHKSQPPTAPCKCRVECQTICNYLPTPRTQLVIPTTPAPFDALAILSTADASIIAGTSSHRAVDPI